MKKTLFVIFILIVFQKLVHAQESFLSFPDWTKNAVIYEVNIRQYTPEGTFKAFEKHLPKLKTLGVKIIWFMPIQPVGEKNRKGELGSYYSIQDYTKTNPEFGSLEEFKLLVDKIHELDMYVILDWVANHTSWDNVWTKSNPEFYTKDSTGEFLPPVDDWSDVIDLNYDNKNLWIAMSDAMTFWVTETNIDGFRCDVAYMVPAEFWISVRTNLNKLKMVFMLAEGDDVALFNSGFEMTYNWPLKDLMNATGKGNKTAIDFIDFFSESEKQYPINAYRMNFTTNHDENSWNGTVTERLGESAEMFSVFTFLIKGMPLIYSGQEAGNDKALKFFEKDTINWKDHTNRILFTKLTQLKAENRALWNGEFGGEMNILENAGDDIFAFSREKNGNKIIAMFNISGSEKAFQLKNLGDFTNYFSGKKISISEKYSGTIDKWGYLVLVN